MEKVSKNTSNKKAIYLIILCWLVYTISYIGKLSYSANIAQIIKYFSVNKKQAGLVGSFFFCVYGAGQIFNGIFCKKYNIKYVIFCSLIVASLMNLLVVIVPKFFYIKYLWLINGASMSFLWTSLIRLLSETLNIKDINKAIVVMGTTVATGTFIVYGLSAIFVAFLSFKIIFYFASFMILLVAFIWIFAFNKIVIPLKQEQEQEHNEELEKHEIEQNNKSSSSKSIIFLMCILACFAIANNFVKDGLTTWTPKILSELYNTPGWLSILLTLLLPTLAIFGTILAVTLQKIFKNFIKTCLALFLATTLLIALVIVFINSKVIVITIICFSLVSCLMAGVNNVITSMVPLNLKESGNSGKIAGILNGFCYLGSTLSSFGLGAIADNFGWNMVLYVLISLSTLVVILGIIHLLIKKS